MLTRGRRDSDTGAVWPTADRCCAAIHLWHIFKADFFFFPRLHCATEPMRHFEVGFSGALWDPLNHPPAFLYVHYADIKNSERTDERGSLEAISRRRSDVFVLLR